MTTSDATVVCVLTPAGRGAVAVVAVDGAKALQCTGRFFRARNGKDLGQQPLERIVYGYWHSSEESSEGEDLIVCRRDTTRLEIHCHGGSQSSAQIVNDLASAGCQVVDQNDWLRGHVRCPLQAAAQQSLSQAMTARAAAILLDQYHGALRREIEAIIDDLNNGNTDQATSRIESLLKFAPLGLHLTKPWRVVIAGQPNVGKSSLINALVGFQRAIVYDQPGTTRDVVTAATAVDGWPVELSDTAGLHSTDDTIESAGVDLARERLASADLVVWVLDARKVANASGSPWDLAIEQAGRVGVQLAEDRTTLVINKSDLADLAIEDTPSTVCTSATTGLGVDRLLAQIATRLVQEVPVAGAPIAFLAEQVQSLQTSARSLPHSPKRAAEQLAALLAFD